MIVSHPVVRSADADSLQKLHPLKAITYQNYGPPSVLTVTEVEKPVAKDNAVLIKVGAAEATKTDCELRSFKFSVKWFWLPLRILSGIRRPRKQILGGYFSGEIASIGKDVTDFSVGDRVFGTAQLAMGAYGEYMTLPENYPIVAMPENMTFAEAAAVPLGGFNALHFMRLARIQAGETVLINGAGGVIGAHAVQIAKAMGAQVTAVDIGFKEEVVRSFGADDFIDYTKESFVDLDEFYDVILDMVPTSSYSGCINRLNPNGRYLSGNPRLSVMLRSVLTTRFTDKTAAFTPAPESKDALLAIKGMIEKGEIGSIVDRVLPMSEAAQAHTLVETEQRRGAIVLAIGDKATS